ncbi:MAG: chemotaxis protein CheW [Myxococcales bacterium]
MTARPVSAPAAPPREQIMQLCAFRVGEEEYVLDIMRIKEIIPPLRITQVPHAPPFVVGVVNLRGAIIPIVDLRERLSLPPAPPTRRTRYLICMVGGRRVGLVVDAVTEVLRIPRGSIKPAPALLAGPGPKFFVGVCGEKERLKLLLNVRALLESTSPVPNADMRALVRGEGGAA